MNVVQIDIIKPQIARHFSAIRSVISTHFDTLKFISVTQLLMLDSIKNVSCMLSD